MGFKSLQTMYILNDVQKLRTKRKTKHFLNYFCWEAMHLYHNVAPILKKYDSRLYKQYIYGSVWRCLTIR